MLYEVITGWDHERSEEEAIRMWDFEKELFKLLHNQRRPNMPLLAINVDHVATVRQARGGAEPDPVLAAGICELAGAEGIVVHLREDRRHIQDRDVRLLRQTVKTNVITSYSIHYTKLYEKTGGSFSEMIRWTKS